MQSEWRVVRVEDIAARQPSAMATGPFGSSISAKYFTDDGVPVIRGSNLSADVSTRLIDDGLAFISPDKAKEFQRSVARRGDLVFTCWGTINQVGLIDASSRYEEYVVSNKQMKLTLDPTKAEARFIYYVFSSPEKQSEILENGIGSSVPGFNLGQLRAHEIHLPPLHEQRSIAGQLKLFDDRIDLLRQTNTTLESIAQALFKSWFIDFDPVRAKAERREPEGIDSATAALFPAEFEEAESRVMPAGWSIGSLSTLCELTKGCSYKGAGLSDSEGAYMFNLGCFNAQRVYATEKVKRYVGEYRSRHVVSPGDLIIANTDMTQARDILGRPVLVPDGFEPGFISHHVFKVSPKPSSGSAASAIRAYLFFALQQPEFRERAIGFATGTTVLALPASAVLECPAIIPPENVLLAFSHTDQPLLARIRENERPGSHLAELRDTLLPRLISGKLRLRETEAELERAVA